MAALPSIPKELIDQFVTGPMSAEAVNAASMAFKKALIERALGAELGHRLSYPPGAAKPEDASNRRNGTTGKTVLTDKGRRANPLHSDNAPPPGGSVARPRLPGRPPGGQADEQTNNSGAMHRDHKTIG